MNTNVLLLIIIILLLVIFRPFGTCFGQESMAQPLMQVQHTVPTATPCVEDVNFDGTVDISDAIRVINTVLQGNCQ